MKTTINGVVIEYTDSKDLSRQLAKLRAKNQDKYNEQFGITTEVVKKVAPAASAELTQKTEDAPVVEATPVVEVVEQVEVQQVTEEGPKVEKVVAKTEDAPAPKTNKKK